MKLLLTILILLSSTICYGEGYECEKHGDIGYAIYDIYTNENKTTHNYCLMCMGELLDKCIGQVKEIK